jgi:hypothetical protein
VIGDVFGTRGSLHRSFSEARGFYAAFSALILLAAAVVLIPRAPLGVIVEAVQALCGIVLPLTTLFLLMLCNDRQVLGPWTNPPWLKAFASVVVGTLILLSLILTITTLFPGVDVRTLAALGAVLLVLALLPIVRDALRSGRSPATVTIIDSGPQVPKEQWTMPPAALLSRPRWSPGRRAAMMTLGGYMIVALALLLVKSVQLAGG